MKTKMRLIKKKEKDGVMKTVTEVKEKSKIILVYEYYHRDTGLFEFDAYDEDGGTVGVLRGHVPEILMPALKNRYKNAK